MSRPASQLSCPISELGTQSCPSPTPPAHRPPQRPGRRPVACSNPRRPASRQKAAGPTRLRHSQQGGRSHNSSAPVRQQGQAKGKIGIRGSQSTTGTETFGDSCFAFDGTNARGGGMSHASTGTPTHRLLMHSSVDVAESMQDVTRAYCPEGECYEAVGDTELGVPPKACPDHPLLVQCPSGDHPMSRVTFSQAEYDVYFCNACRTLSAGNRWHCAEHHDDYCLTCWPCSDALSAGLMGRPCDDARCSLDGRAMAWVQCAPSDEYMCNVCSCVSRGSHWHCDEHQDNCCALCHPQTSSTHDTGLVQESSCTHDYRMSISSVREVDTEQSVDIENKKSVSIRSMEDDSKYDDRGATVDDKASSLPLDYSTGSVRIQQFENWPRYTEGSPHERVRIDWSHSDRLHRLLEPPPFCMNSTHDTVTPKSLPKVRPAMVAVWHNKRSTLPNETAEARDIEETRASIKAHLPSVLQNWMAGSSPGDDDYQNQNKRSGKPTLRRLQTTKVVKSSVEQWMMRAVANCQGKQVTPPEDQEQDWQEEYKAALYDVFHGTDAKEHADAKVSISHNALTRLAQHLQISYVDVCMGKRAFDHVDTDRDGLINKDEFELAGFHLLQAINRGSFCEEEVEPDEPLETESLPPSPAVRKFHRLPTGEVEERTLCLSATSKIRKTARMRTLSKLKTTELEAPSEEPPSPLPAAAKSPACVKGRTQAFAKSHTRTLCGEDTIAAVAKSAVFAKSRTLCGEDAFAQGSRAATFAKSRTHSGEEESVGKKPEVEEPRPTEEALERVRSMTEGRWRAEEKGPDDPIDFPEFLHWYSLIGFREELMLTDEQCELRKYARTFGIPPDIVDTTKQQFAYYDSNDSGTIDFSEFSAVVTKLMKIKAPMSLSMSRLQYFWSEVDRDNSGMVSFEEFLEWWLKYFDPSGGPLPFESFYNGIRRVGASHLDPSIHEILAQQAKQEVAVSTGQVETLRRHTVRAAESRDAVETLRAMAFMSGL